jgi:alpha-D-xyloside xylohydrolase
MAIACAIVPACSEARIGLLDPPFTIGEGRFRLDVRNGGSTIVLSRDGTTMLTLDPNAFQLGVVSELGVDRSWDPWDIERGISREAASGVTFRSPIAWSAQPPIEGREAEIHLDYGGGLRARVAIAAPVAGTNALAVPDPRTSTSRFTVTFVPGARSDARTGAPAVALARIRLRTTGDPQEGFYGLGEQVDSVDNRGKLRAMQMEPDDVESTYNEAHAPVPMLLGTRGWGIFATSKRVGVFDVARKDPAIVEATFAVAALRGDGDAEALRVELFAGDAAIDLYREYYAASGAPRLPPSWAFGPWIWRSETKDQAAVVDDVAKIRELDLATSGVWLDRRYAHAVNTFDFDPGRFPDPPSMIARAHAGGLRMALWSSPYLEPTATPMIDEANSRGYFPGSVGRPLNVWGSPIDFTSPAASRFWRELVQRYTLAGIDGFKLDFGEDPSVPSLPPPLGDKRNVWRFSDDSDERTMHHRFSGLYHRVYFDAATGRDPTASAPANPEVPFLLVRSAHWGEQTLAVVVWPPEMDATFTRHKEPVVTRTGETVLGVGGLPTTIVMGLSLSASGFPFFAADTGGYRHGPADKELFLRWVEQTALSTVMQVRLGDESSWLKPGGDTETLDIYRTYARLHMRLFPYAWSYAHRMAADGRPIVRPLGLAHPELGVHPDDEYMFGDDLLVAPIVARGATRRRLAIPEGSWIDFWDGTPRARDGRGEIEVDAPLGKLPLFLRDGAIVPMLRPTIDTLADASDEGIESFVRDPGPLWVMIAPGPPRSFDLWEGTHIARTVDGTFEVRSGAVFDRGFVLQLIGVGPPIEVARDAGLVPNVGSLEELTTQPTGWTWTPDRRGTLTIKLPPTRAEPPGDVRITVR